jgi:PAS domain S-box-containing protein
MLESNPVPCFVADGNLRTTYFNPAMRALSGYSERDYSGQPVSLLSPDPEAFNRFLTDTLEGRTISGPEQVFIASKEGSTIPCRITAIHLLGPEDRAHAILCIVSDMSHHLDTLETLKSRSDRLGALASIASRISIYTDVQRLSREALQAVADLLPIKAGFLLLVSEDTGTLYFNEGFNLPVEKYEQFHSDRNWDDYLEGQVVREKSSILIEDVTSESREVRYVPGSMSLGLVPLQTRERVVGVLSVTTAAPHRLDQADMEFLLALGSQLGIYFENARLLETLRDTNQQLIRQNQDLEELLSIISHDLRSPLATVGGYSSLLMSKGEELSPDERSEAAATIFRKTRETSDRFDDLLSVFRATVVPKEEDPRPFHVRDVIRTALEESAPADVVSRFSIRLPENLPVLTGYANHLTHIFTNLFSNAFKFIGRQENPCIEVSYEQTEGPGGINQRFTVIDNGMGIPKGHLGSVFKPFYRVRKHGEIPGSGIGLAAVNRIVRNHKGTVSVNSTEGEGTSFTFTLPWKKAEEPVPGS